MLWFKPYHSQKVVLGHYTSMDRAVADGHYFRNRYIDKLSWYIQDDAKELCVFWIEVMDEGLNMNIPVRLVRPVQTPGDKKREEPECS